MRVSCSVPRRLATSTLEDNIRIIGLEPIVTPEIIRAVYEGDNVGLGEALIDMFSHQADHEITVDYRTTQEKREGKKASRQPWHTYLGRKEVIR